MSVMKRCSVRTYSKTRDNGASRAFDEMLNNKGTTRPVIKAGATVTKWGKTSFTPVRGTGKDSSRPLYQSTRRRSDQRNTDPFSFDTEELRSPKKKYQKGTVVPLQTAQSNSPPSVAVVSVKPEVNKIITKIDAPPSKFFVSKIRTYSKASHKVEKLPMSDSRPSMGNMSDHSYTSPTKRGNIHFSGTMEPSKLPSQSRHRDTAKDASVDLSDDDDANNFTFKRQPLKTYGGRTPTVTHNKTYGGLTPTMTHSKASISLSPPTPSGSLQGSPQSAVASSIFPTAKKPFPSGYVGNVRFKNTVNKFSNSTLVSRKELKDSKGTTIIFVCKPKLGNEQSDGTFEHTMENVESAAEMGYKISMSIGKRSGETANIHGSDSSAPSSPPVIDRMTPTVPDDNRMDSESPKDLNGGGDAPVLERAFTPPLMETEVPGSSQESTDTLPLSDAASDSPESITNGSADEALGSEKAIKKRKFFKRDSSRLTKYVLKSRIQEQRDKQAPGVVAEKQNKIFCSPKKSPSKAMYKVRSWHADWEDTEDKVEEKKKTVPENAKKATSSKRTSVFDEFDELPMAPPKMTRMVHWPDKIGDEAFTSIKVSKQHKSLFTVVKNVKEAHEVQEYGETQEFMDDIDYLLDGVQATEPLSTRCLSCFGIVMKCTLPAFRMHLRAHGKVTQIFNQLSDACCDPSLALSTAALMFILSRDRLNMDLDQQSLDLMLKLLGVDGQQHEANATLSNSTKKDYERMKGRVQELCVQLQKDGVDVEVDMDTISTANLAMESLLSLTSRRAGEWFKEELRNLGALDHIVDTVSRCAESLVNNEEEITDSILEKHKKMVRCLRVLEHVTFMNTDNQSYLVAYEKSKLIRGVCGVLQFCTQYIHLHPLEGNADDKGYKDSKWFIVFTSMLSILRVLLNITHENEYGCTKVGEHDDVLSIILTCVLQTPQFVPTEQSFDLLVLSLGLLINLVEHCSVNRTYLIRMNLTFDPQKRLAVAVLVELFQRRENEARKIEQQGEKGEGKDEKISTPESSPDKSGVWHESESGLEWIISSAKKVRKAEEERQKTPNDARKVTDDDEQALIKALHKAGRHMEDSIVAAYIGLLLGCVIQDNQENVEIVRGCLQDGSFEPMIYILKKFLGFMNLTNAASATGGHSISKVIEVLEAC